MHRPARPSPGTLLHLTPASPSLPLPLSFFSLIKNDPSIGEVADMPPVHHYPPQKDIPAKSQLKLHFPLVKLKK